MTPIAAIVKCTDLDNHLAQIVCDTILGVERGRTELNAGEAMVVLLVDFFRMMGMTMEQYLPIIQAVKPKILEYGKRLPQDLEDSLAGKRGPICVFVELIDGRYVGYRDPYRSDAFTVDLETGETVPRIPNAPIYSMTVNVCALYLKTVAKISNHDSEAEHASVDGLMS